MQGLIDKRLEQVSQRRAPVDEVMALVVTQFGKAMARLGIEMIPAYSPEARGRSERMFRTHQGRLPQELAAAGIIDMAAANRYREAVYRGAFNAEFMQGERA